MSNFAFFIVLYNNNYQYNMLPKDIIFIKKEKQPLPFIILSVLFIISGIYLIIDSSDIIQIISGVLLIITSAVFLSSKTDLFYKPDINALVIKRRFLFKVFEKLESLPEIHYIALVKVRTSQNLNVLVLSTQIKGVATNLNFVFKNSTLRFLKLSSGNKNDMLKKAKELSEKLQVPILDSTTNEKIWINN